MLVGPAREVLRVPWIKVVKYDFKLDQLEMEVFHQEAIDADIIQRMMDVKYSPADLSAEVGECSNLTKTEQQNCSSY